jgi:deoxyribodipyrimidine photo-lyase
MSRDQRAADNWALLHAQQQAINRMQPLVVVFCLVPDFLSATLRQYGFMLRGLQSTFRELEQKNIACHLLLGQPHEVLPDFLTQLQASLLVTDFDPLRIKRLWKEKLIARLATECHEVDAHNIVPCWVASPKLEFAAYTLRPKIKKLLPEFLEQFPPLERHPHPSALAATPLPEIAHLMEGLNLDRRVTEVDWLQPGGQAALSQLDSFLQDGLDDYGVNSNDPALDRQSQLSPYLHFGQLSAQRTALEVLRRDGPVQQTEAFLEELIVRRELADNYCWYNPDYDSPAGFPAWAQQTLAEHLDDPRSYLYSPTDFEQAATHDTIWNAAQRQMTKTGKMHGYMRMYWAKKILEWSESPRQAMQTAIYLNDKYELDGRDPNGYAGIAWSIGGVHDRAWSERQIFGKIRYMNDKGLRRKFAIDRYCERFAKD